MAFEQRDCIFDVACAYVIEWSRYLHNGLLVEAFIQREKADLAPVLPSGDDNVNIASDERLDYVNGLRHQIVSERRLRAVPDFSVFRSWKSTIRMTMNVIIATLLIVAVAASVGNPQRAPLLTAGVTGMAAIMIGVMVLPGFSGLAGASLTILLALLVLAGAVLGRVMTRRPVEPWHKVATATTVVDLVFMSITMLLMPEHGAGQHLAAAAPVGGGVESHAAAASGSLMVWLTILAWALCSAVLTVPKQPSHTTGRAFHIVCSCSMIAAMAAMTI